MNAPQSTAQVAVQGQAYPSYSPAERVADAVIHGLSVVGSLAAFVTLMIIAAPMQDAGTMACLIIYGLGVTTVFGVSAAYHLIPLPSWKSVLRRLDHAAIFVKIAGTYTPFALVGIGGVWGLGLMGAVWTIAALGVPLKLWAPDKLGRWAVWLYLLQGWLVIFALGPAANALPSETLTLIVIGGALYTIGVGFFLSEKLPFHNAIWHGFVLAASGFMYAAVLTGVAFVQPAVA